jgi:hypothetical protein
LEYPVAVASAVVWWLLVGVWIRRRGSRANHRRAA